MVSTLNWGAIFPGIAPVRYHAPRFGQNTLSDREQAGSPGSHSQHKTGAGLNPGSDRFQKQGGAQDVQDVRVDQTQAKVTFQERLQQVLSYLQERSVEPPKEDGFVYKAKKLETAKHLAQWMQTTLNRDGAQVAVVARQGHLQQRKYDPTGMVHSGIALFHPREKRWKIYNLIDRPQGKHAVCEITWVEPEDFFIQQGGTEKNALLMIPDPLTQARMQTALLNGTYRKFYFARDYNLVSPPSGRTSLNCNKWVLLNVLAAQKNNYHLESLLKDIQAHFRPGEIDVHPIARLFAAQQPRVRAHEVPWWAPIHTVTVNSLLHSGLFETVKFHSPDETAK